MRTVSSYGVELRKQNIPIRQTLDIYRSAVSCLIEIYAQIWDELAVITEPKNRFNTAEHLVHTTKKNQARFDFDLRFPKMPSYLRRAAIQHALGSVSSYKTRMELWKKTDQKGGRPKLVCDNHAMPVFYRDVMYREDTEEKDGACLKLYDGHDWKWFRVSLSHTDMEYLRKNWAGKKAAAPVLEKRHRKYFLRFSYTEEVPLTKTPVKEPCFLWNLLIRPSTRYIRSFSLGKSINFLPRTVPSARIMVQTTSVLSPKSTLQMICSFTGVFVSGTSSV